MPELTIELDERYIELLDKVAKELGADRNVAICNIFEQLGRYVEMAPFLDSIADHERRIIKLEGGGTAPQRVRKTISGREIRW